MSRGHATASLAPWFTHARMMPKWVGIAVMFTLLAWQWTPWALVAGAVGFAWFFPNEYGVHRWVYHRVAVSEHVRGPARSHIQHHVAPTSLDRIFNDPRFSVTVGVAYFLAAWGLFALLGAARAIGIAAGFSAGNFVALLYYEYVHFTAHRPGVTPWLPWNRFLKRMHLWHHYKNENFWFGVTTRRFDDALGSFRAPEDVERSQTVRSLVPPEALQKYL
jgi:hypothetical protein